MISFLHRAALSSLLVVLFCAAPAISAESTQANRKLLACDYSKSRVAWLDSTGKITWERKTAGMHDLSVLPNGNILMGDGWTKVIEVTPGMNGAQDKVVWEYDAAKQNRTDNKKVEVHAFQRLPNGNTMIAESGPCRLIEVDKDGKLVKEIKLQVKHPSTHSDTRQARQLPNGHYLVCHENDGTLREYDEAGKVIWEYEVPMFDKKPAGGHGPEAFGNHLFSALRLENGNTLIATGNGHSVLEVTPEKKIVWQLTQDELPGIKLAWVTTLQVLPNGNIVLANCHATEANPQIIEVTREKKVVWTFKDFKNFGNALANSVVVDK
jgi:hypothetical protein